MSTWKKATKKLKSNVKRIGGKYIGGVTKLFRNPVAWSRSIDNQMGISGISLKKVFGKIDQFNRAGSDAVFEGVAGVIPERTPPQPEKPSIPDIAEEVAQKRINPRRRAFARSRSVYTSSLGAGSAQVVRKYLTGQ